MKLASGCNGTTTNSKFGFRTNSATVGMLLIHREILELELMHLAHTLDVRGSAIFNEAGAAVDFRIEGDT